MTSVKNAMNRQQLWERLQQQSLAVGDLPPADASSSPWYVRVMLGIAGWIGALFLFAFVGIGFYDVIKNTVAALIAGTLCCAAAYALFRAARNNDFAMQFGLAVSLAGQGLFVVGLFNGFEHRASALYGAIVLFEAMLALLVPNFIHRVLTSAAAAVALSFALSSLGFYGLTAGMVSAGMALIWMNQQYWLGKGALWRPIGYGMVLALLQIESTRLFGLSTLLWSTARGIDWWMQYGWWVSTALVTVVLMWSVTRMLNQQQMAVFGKAGAAALVAAVLVGALSLMAPGIATALLILLLGFATGNRILMGLGIFALLGFISHYYYQLQSTLLVKSMVLAATGMALLGARLALRRMFPMTAEAEVSHA